MKFGEVMVKYFAYKYFVFIDFSEDFSVPVKNAKATQLSTMHFIDSALSVRLVGQSTLNPGYYNDISFGIFCSIASLLGYILIRLDVLHVVYTLSKTIP